MLKPQYVLETLQRLTAERDDIIWTTGVGQHQMWAMQYLLCDRPRTFITSGGLGTMGYGIPAAIGAKAARPDATVICVDGDGCFQMTQQELATAVLEDLPIVVVIVNNGYLGMVRQWQDMFFDERFSEVHLTHHVPDYAKLAEACGIPSHMASEHLRLMQRSGFLSSEKDGRKAYYQIAEPHLANIMACIEARFGGKQ